MGVYDEYEGIQLKIGEPACRSYRVGDAVEAPDGCYVGHEGVVVIKDGLFVAKFKHLVTKWGDKLSCATFLEDCDEISRTIEELSKNKEIKNGK